MPKYFLIETTGPFTVAKDRTVQHRAAMDAVLGRLARAADRQGMADGPEHCRAHDYALDWHPERGDTRPLVVTLGNYTVTARRVDA